MFCYKIIQRPGHQIWEYYLKLIFTSLSRTLPSAYLDPVDQRSEQEHKELHRGHGVVEDLPPAVLFVIVGAALARHPWRTLVFNLVDKSTAAAAPAGSSVCAPKPLTVAVLGGLQEHPMEGVKKFGLSDTQFILVACMGYPQSQVKANSVTTTMMSRWGLENTLALLGETLAFFCAPYNHC